MLFNSYNHIHITFVSILVFFLLITGILYLIKPLWVQKLNRKNGKLEIHWLSLLSYAFTFSLICSIITFFYVKGILKKINEKNEQTQKTNSDNSKKTVKLKRFDDSKNNKVNINQYADGNLALVV